MKKSLLALAAMGAFAGAAQAQSSVTVYGILDVGYIGGTQQLRSTGLSTNGGTNKATFSQFGTSAETSSRLGFRGTEDLGGGMNAFFTAEFQLYPTDQTLSGNNAQTTASSTNYAFSGNGGLLNRQAFVGLSKKGLGQAAIGTQYTPVFNASAATDPGQHNNILGNVIYASASGGVATTEYDGSGAITTSFTNRTSNTLSFKTDRFAGLSLSGMYSLNQKTASQLTTTGGMQNANGWGLSVDYQIQKFYVTAAYQALKQFTTYGTTNQVWGGAQANGAGSPLDSSSNALNVQDNQFLAGATYDFGILKAYAQYVSRKATATDDSAYFVKRSAQQLGVRGMITKTIEGWASVGNGRYTIWGASEPTTNFNGWQLGTNYLLSKRTNLYAIYGQQVMSTGTTNAGVAASATANNYAVGVRHTF